MRTDQEILDQTNKLAEILCALRGYQVKEGHRFDQGTHPYEVDCWNGACAAQELLTDTDMENVLAELEIETPDHPRRATRN